MEDNYTLILEDIEKRNVENKGEKYVPEFITIIYPRTYSLSGSFKEHKTKYILTKFRKSGYVLARPIEDDAVDVDNDHKTVWFNEKEIYNLAEIDYTDQDAFYTNKFVKYRHDYSHKHVNNPKGIVNIFVSHKLFNEHFNKMTD
jgi:hypothetical protein